VKDMTLADAGRNLVQWAEDHMPVLMNIRADFKREQPLNGMTIACCLHVTKETAVLMRALLDGGASVVL